MPEVLAKMTPEEIAEYREIINWREAAELSVNDLTLEKAHEIVRRDREFAQRIREKYELEDWEVESKDMTSGAILSVSE